MEVFDYYHTGTNRRSRLRPAGDPSVDRAYVQALTARRDQLPSGNRIELCGKVGRGSAFPRSGRWRMALPSDTARFHAGGGADQRRAVELGQLHMFRYQETVGNSSIRAAGGQGMSAVKSPGV